MACRGRWLRPARFPDDGSGPVRGGMLFLHGLAMEGAGNMYDAYIFPLSSMLGRPAWPVRFVPGHQGRGGRAFPGAA